MPKIRTGIIGMGVMGEIFFRCIRDLPFAELAAVADVSPAVREACAGAGVKGYADYREMLAKERLDAVLILTPDEYHLEPVLDARKAGLHIFLEKPLATELAQARQIVHAAESSGKVFLVGHTLRYDPRFVNGYHAVATGQIGEMLHIRSWRESAITHGLRLKGRCSAMMFLGVHDLDIYNWYVGQPIKRVFAMSSSKKLQGMGLDTPDTFFATLEYQNGVIGQLAASWVLPETQGKPSNFRAKGMEVVGTRGMLSIESDNTGVVIQTENLIDMPDNLYRPQLHGLCFGVYREELLHFFACVEGRAQPATTARDAYRAAAAAHAIEQSAASGQVIEVEETL